MPVVAQRVLPVTAPPPPRAPRPDVPGARALPVVQRAADPTLPSPTLPSPTLPSPTVPTPPLVASKPGPVPEAGPEQRDLNPEPATAPLSGFARAIERLSVQSEIDAPVEQTDRAPVVPGPLVPVVPARGTPVADPGSDAMDLRPSGDVSAAVQRDAETGADAVPDALTLADGQTPTTGEVVPLVGSDDGTATRTSDQVEPPALQRAALDDLPVVPLAREIGRTAGVDDVPRLEVSSSRSAVPVPSRSGSPASADPVAPPTPVVARTVIGSPSATPESSVPPAAGSAEPADLPVLPSPAASPAASATATPLRTAPLAGSRTTSLQRSVLEPAAASRASLPEPVRPLRFESVDVVRAAAAALSAAASPRTPQAAGVPVGTSLQRATTGVLPPAALPAVAPGLVGAAPDEPDRGAGGFLTPATGPASTWTGDDLDESGPGLVVGGAEPFPPQTVQRLVAPAGTISSPVARPAVVAPRPATGGPPVRALPFDQMFQGGHGQTRVGRRVRARLDHRRPAGRERRVGARPAGGRDEAAITRNPSPRPSPPSRTRPGAPRPPAPAPPAPAGEPRLRAAPTSTRWPVGSSTRCRPGSGPSCGWTANGQDWWPMPASDLRTPIAVSVFFIVQIDDKDLGSFNSCEGLGVEVVIEQREEGGNNGFVWQLPTRVKYSNIKLTRPVGPRQRQADGLAGELRPRRGATDRDDLGDDRRRHAWSPPGTSTASSRSAGPARASTRTRPRSPPRPSSSPTTASCPAQGRDMAPADRAQRRPAAAPLVQPGRPGGRWQRAQGPGARRWRRPSCCSTTPAVR